MTITSKTSYFSIKKALFEAIRYFCETGNETILILVKTDELKSRYFEFSRSKIEKQLGFKLFGNMEGFILATCPGKNDEPDGILYHKSNILKIFNNSTI